VLKENPPNFFLVRIGFSFRINYI